MVKIKVLTYEYPDSRKVRRYEIKEFKVIFTIESSNKDIERFDSIEEAVHYMIRNSFDKTKTNRPILKIDFIKDEKWHDETSPNSPILLDTRILEV